MMEKRKCKSCGGVFSLKGFAHAGTIKGIRYYRHQCIKCYSKIKDIRRNNIAEQVREYKKTLTCERCGFNDHRALQFHHIDGDDKVAEIANMRGWGFDTIKEEIAKCEVLCANCHQIEHSRSIA